MARLVDIEQRIAALLNGRHIEPDSNGSLSEDDSQYLAEMLTAELGLTYFEVDNGAEYWYATNIWKCDE